MPAPHPEFRPRLHRRLTGDLAAGTVITALASKSEYVPVFGAARVRVRAKVSATSTLKGEFTQPPETSATDEAEDLSVYTSGNPSNVALSAATEAKMDVEPWGEGYLKITITAGAADSTVTFVDVSQE